jgi:hypothetical protein
MSTKASEVSSIIRAFPPVKPMVLEQSVERVQETLSDNLVQLVKDSAKLVFEGSYGPLSYCEAKPRTLDILSQKFSYWKNTVTRDEDAKVLVVAMGVISYQGREYIMYMTASLVDSEDKCQLDNPGAVPYIMSKKKFVQRVQNVYGYQEVVRDTNLTDLIPQLREKE